MSGKRSIRRLLRGVARSGPSRRVVPPLVRRACASVTLTEAQQKRVKWLSRNVPARSDSYFTAEVSPGVPVQLRLSHTARYLYFEGSYEPETMGPFLALARSSNVFLDIGAQAGLFGISAALVNPDLIAVGFEIDPLALDVLVDNIGANGLTDRYRAVALAMGDGPSIADAYLRGGVTSLLEAHRGGERRLGVPVSSVDAALEWLDLSTIDLVKIDTENTEDRVLAGMSDVLRNHRPVIVVEVLRPENAQAVHDCTETYGYRRYRCTGEGLVALDVLEKDKTWHNYLLVPEERDAEVRETLSSWLT